MSHRLARRGVLSAGDNPVFIDDPIAGVGTTELAAYNAAWSKHPSFAVNALLSNSGNRIRLGAVGTARYIRSEVPPAADYSVEVDVAAVTLTGLTWVGGVLFRYNAATNDGYVGEYEVTNTGTVRQWRIRKVVSGVHTVIGTPFAETLAPGAVKRMALEGVGADLRLLTFDGSVWTSRIAFTDASSPFLSAGRAGITLFNGGTINDTTGPQLDNFRART